MSQMREGFAYKVFCTNVAPDIYQIGAKIRENEPFHGGNVHWLEGWWRTEEEAEAALKAMKTPVACPEDV